MAINISTSLATHRWNPACWLRVAGDDAAQFLQGQFTNDLRPLPETAAVYGLWLTLKGKVLADSFVLRGATPNEFWIGSYFSSGLLIRERIESHVIADDVTVEDVTGSWAGISVVGEGADQHPPGAAAKSCFVFPGRRQRAQNIEYVFPLSSGETAGIESIRLSAKSVDAEEMERRRIAAGIPAVPADVGPADLPNEAGLEADAVSYTKGCYLGQEVMARLKSMGQVRRRLMRVRGAGEIFPAVPAPVFVGPRQVGELRSAVRDGVGGWIGLAMLSRMHVSATTDLSFAAEASPVVRLMDVP